MDSSGIIVAIEKLTARINEEAATREEQMDDVVASLAGIERALQSNEMLLALHGIEDALRQIGRGR